MRREWQLLTRMSMRLSISYLIIISPNTEAKKNLQKKFAAELATMVLRETVSVGESIAIAVAALGSGVAVGMSVSDEPTPHLITPLEATMPTPSRLYLNGSDTRDCP